MDSTIDLERTNSIPFDYVIASGPKDFEDVMAAPNSNGVADLPGRGEISSLSSARPCRNNEANEICNESTNERSSLNSETGSISSHKMISDDGKSYGEVNEICSFNSDTENSSFCINNNSEGAIESNSKDDSSSSCNSVLGGITAIRFYNNSPKRSISKMNISKVNEISILNADIGNNHLVNNNSNGANDYSESVSSHDKILKGKDMGENRNQSSNEVTTLNTEIVTNETVAFNSANCGFSSQDSSENATNRLRNNGAIMTFSNEVSIDSSSSSLSRINGPVMPNSDITPNSSKNDDALGSSRDSSSHITDGPLSPNLDHVFGNESNDSISLTTDMTEMSTICPVCGYDGMIGSILIAHCIVMHHANTQQDPGLFKDDIKEEEIEDSRNYSTLSSQEEISPSFNRISKPKLRRPRQKRKLTQSMKSQKANRDSRGLSMNSNAQLTKRGKKRSSIKEDHFSAKIVPAELNKVLNSKNISKRRRFRENGDLSINPEAPLDCSAVKKALNSERSGRTNLESTLELPAFGQARSGKKFPCSECTFGAKFKSKLLSHVNEVHRKITPYECTSCSYKSKRKDMLEMHLRRKHAGEEGVGRTIPVDSALSKVLSSGGHESVSETSALSTVRSRKKFPCLECSFRANSRRKIAVHVKKVHHKIKPSDPHKSKKKQGLEDHPQGKNHTREEEDHVRPVDDKYKGLNDALRDALSAFTGVEPEASERLKKKKLRAQKKLKKKRVVLNNKPTHSEDGDSKENLVASENVSVNDAGSATSCPSEDRSSKMMKLKKKRFLRRSEEEGQELGADLAQPDSQIIKRKHNKEMPENNNSDLKKRKRKTPGKTPLREGNIACSECDHVATRMSNLKVHVRTMHRMERDFGCGQCSYRAAQKTHLKTHVRRSHPQSPDEQKIRGVLSGE